MVTNLQTALGPLIVGVTGTMAQITGLLVRYQALSTIVTLVLLNILVRRLFGSRISAGSSDKAIAKQSKESTKA